MAGAEGARDWPVSDRQTALNDYRRVRRATEALCAPLETEDYGLQTMPDVSPAKWHIAHTSWFFETFILLPFGNAYRVFDPSFDHLFNSYYVTHGTPFQRPQRGFLARPTVRRIFAYRQTVDAAIADLLDNLDQALWARVEPLLYLGLNHEQQHQELLLTDLKHAFAQNPLRPAYRRDLSEPPVASATPGAAWRTFDGGLFEIGAGADGFAYDNEQPRHRVWVEGYALAERPVSNADYLAFIEDGGYRNPRWWLSEGWAKVQTEGWQAPLYWERRDGAWWHFTLAGMRPLDPAAPVCHVSHYEADAYASWAGRRLPTETEWEIAACREPPPGTHRGAARNLRDAGYLQPIAGSDSLFGNVWEWTASPYVAYPGFRAPDGPIGEYNGKFMSGQLVLRGGSCVTPDDHVRPTYRNFFYPWDRWQFSGIRLADNR